jgi:surface antigen
VNRTVGVALRRSVGGGAIFALSFGALASAPAHEARTVDAAASAALASPTERFDEARPHAAPAAVMIYVEATPVPATRAVVSRASTARTTSAPVSPRRPPVAPPAPLRAVKPAPGAANGFTYGYCTWWVAHKRYVPWRGNAAQWWWNARSFGYSEGRTPRAGAIMVMGYSGTSPQGHVGYVESVNRNGSFVVSEMNWWGVPGGGWGRVDYRTVTSLRGVLGFIY